MRTTVALFTVKSFQKRPFLLFVYIDLDYSRENSFILPMLIILHPLLWQSGWGPQGPFSAWPSIWPYLVMSFASLDSQKWTNKMVLACHLSISCLLLYCPRELKRHCRKRRSWCVCVKLSHGSRRCCQLWISIVIVMPTQPRLNEEILIFNYNGELFHNYEGCSEIKIFN